MHAVNNRFYDDLGTRWYDDDGHAIALLKAEATIKFEYVTRALLGRESQRVLDLGCGAGFIAIPLARAGHDVTGIDLSESTLSVARSRSSPELPVRFERADVCAVPEPDASFDAVLALDLLEHVEQPAALIREAARVLKPGGQFIYHTFNRTPAARLLAIHMLRLVVQECPPDLHVYRAFIKPSELRVMLGAVGLSVEHQQGVMPDPWLADFWRTLLTRRVQPGFGFRFTASTLAGYVGRARRS